MSDRAKPDHLLRDMVHAVNRMRCEIEELRREVAKQQHFVVRGTCWCGQEFEFTPDHADCCEHINVDKNSDEGCTWYADVERPEELVRLRAEVAEPRCPVATGTCAGCPHAKRRTNSD